MTKKLAFTILSFLICTATFSQSKWSLRTNGGYAYGYTEGYYFSFDFGIPIIKSIELAPTFTYSSRLPNTVISDMWMQSNGNYGLSSSEPNSTAESGESSSSISLLLFFKPFDLFKGKKFEKHELLLGTGLSYCSYIKFGSGYRLNGTIYEPTAISTRSNREFAPYYGKIQYNYLFKENLFAGIVMGLNGFDGEAEILTGLQFGVKF